MGKLVLFSFLLVAAIPSNAIAAKPKGYSNYKRLKKSLVKNEDELELLTSKIENLEKKLSKMNKDYLSVIKFKKKVDEQLGSIQSEILIKKNELLKERNITKQGLKNVALLSLNDDQSIEEMASVKFLKAQLNKKGMIIGAKLKNLQVLENQSYKVYERLTDYNQQELALNNLIKELEYNKSSSAESYVKKLKASDKLKQRLKKYSFNKKKKYRKSKKSSRVLGNTNIGGLTFKSPLSNYTSIDYKKAGITFLYRGKSKVVTSHAGKVVYLGRLSNYGNVAMIDHGDGLRSVFLGDFSPVIKKEQLVRSGQVIGLTKQNSSDPTESGKLYFEVRKKDVAQQTTKLMTKSFIKKNNIRNI